MTERPDGHLAPVTYLFGGQAPAEPEAPAGRSASSAAEAEIVRERMAEIEARWGAARAASGAAAGADAASDPDTRTSPSSIAASPTSPSRTEKRAHNVSIAALARRGVSIAEMRDLLERRELEPDVIEQEVERLIDEHLLDDELLAENVIRTSTERKGMGVSAIRAELKRRKIDPLVVEIALGSLDADDEFERALEVATARARQLTSLDRETAERRLSGFLQRRGYGGSTLGRATRAALDATAVRRGPRFE